MAEQTTNRTALLVVASFVLGVFGGLLLAGYLPGDLSYRDAGDNCYVVTLKKGSDKVYYYKEEGTDELVKLEPGVPSDPICVPFDVYESIPTPPKPPGG